MTPLKSICRSTVGRAVEKRFYALVDVRLKVVFFFLPKVPLDWRTFLYITPESVQQVQTRILARSLGRSQEVCRGREVGRRRTLKNS